MSRLTNSIAIVVCLCASAAAQVDRASLTGTVTDASGAVVGDAAVTVESASTGFRRETRTSPAGVYQIPGIVVGSYTVAISKTGFNTVRFENVVLGVGQSRTLDAQIAVGAIATAVEVTAAA